MDQSQGPALTGRRWVFGTPVGLLCFQCFSFHPTPHPVHILWHIPLTETQTLESSLHSPTNIPHHISDHQSYCLFCLRMRWVSGPWLDSPVLQALVFLGISGDPHSPTKAQEIWQQVPHIPHIPSHISNYMRPSLYLEEQWSEPKNTTAPRGRKAFT